MAGQGGARRQVHATSSNMTSFPILRYQEPPFLRPQLGHRRRICQAWANDGAPLASHVFPTRAAAPDRVALHTSAASLAVDLSARRPSQR